MYVGKPQEQECATHEKALKIGICALRFQFPGQKNEC